jgi:hypothetical protein
MICLIFPEILAERAVPGGKICAGCAMHRTLLYAIRHPTSPADESLLSA